MSAMSLGAEVSDNKGVYGPAVRGITVPFKNDFTISSIQCVAVKFKKK